MDKTAARLKHLLVMMEAKYGEHDADVLELRREISKVEHDAALGALPLRYANQAPFADRAVRLSRAGH